LIALLNSSRRCLFMTLAIASGLSGKNANRRQFWTSDISAAVRNQCLSARSGWTPNSQTQRTQLEMA
jgi:hypothetical protein